ncbi:MAG: iron-containing redox enzyme family protein [Acidimicrobiales bacterium]|nr:MAG: iron-containing redox enzyme family protein [Acidimicrobiales bacterium]
MTFTEAGTARPSLTDPEPYLPEPRGAVSQFLFDSLVQPPHSLGPAPASTDDALLGDDAALALYLCYELHYRGWAGVDATWEWEPSLLALRRSLEDRFIQALFHVVGPPAPCTDVEGYLVDLLGRGSGPSLSGYLRDTGTIDQFREFAVHRSAYQLKEADPHSWALPRLSGPPKAALVAIQCDEYGRGDSFDMHSSLFAETLLALDLDPDYGAYLGHVPAVTLTTVNLISLLGLHRRWRGALVGHLAIFEMASVGPNTAYGHGLRRLGMSPEATRFYDVHVTADAVHQVLARETLAGGLARAEPAISGDIAFGARAIMATEERFSRHLLGAWGAERSSLYRPLPQ